jgi:hypothetical protein
MMTVARGRLRGGTGDRMWKGASLLTQREATLRAERNPLRNRSIRVEGGAFRGSNPQNSIPA